MIHSDFFGLLGYLGLTSAFIVCISLILISFISYLNKNQSIEKLAFWLAHTQTILLAVAVFSLAALLKINAFEYRTVFEAVELSMTPFERMGGLWSSQAASLLFWSFIMSAAVSLSLLIAKRIPSANYTITVLVILEITLIFFILPDVFFSNPFQKTWIMPSGTISLAFFPPNGAALLVPMDGQGMNPSLRHIAMFFHPPTLYLGLIGFFIPYAFALSSLINDDRDPTWMRLVFPIALFSWIFLTIGMLLGSWWAYTILGWGGYWGWDAVEISGLLPWLLSFGLIHSLNMQIRGCRFKKWVYFLSFAIVILTLFGILITRSGILESIHAYAGGAMGPMLTTLVLLHLLTVIAMLIMRRLVISEHPIQTAATYTEKFTRLFNFCVIGLVLVYLFGQTLPLTSMLFLPEKISFTPQDYEQYSSPLLFFLLSLTALYPLARDKDANPKKFKRSLIGLVVVSIVCPLTILWIYPITINAAAAFWVAAFLLFSWSYALIRDMIIPFFQKRHTRSARSNKIRLSSILIHFGFAVMAAGIVGVENLSASYDIQAAIGKETNFSQYTLTNHYQKTLTTENGIERFENRISLADPDGNIREFAPFIDHYPKLGSLHSQPTTAAGFFQDVQISISTVPDLLENRSELHISFFPLMSWIWVGGVIMSMGGIIALIVQKH